MKKIIAIIAALAVCAAVSAQKQEKTPAERAAADTKKLQTEYSLTDDQAKQVETAYLTRYNKIAEISENADLSKEEATKQRGAAVGKFNKSLKEILTTEQFQAYTDAVKAKQPGGDKKPAEAPKKGKK